MRNPSMRTRIAWGLVAAMVVASCAADDPALDSMADTTSSVTMADMADDGGMDDMDDMDHDHEEGATTEWEGPAPQLEVVIRDGLITLDATGFEFADPSDTEPLPGFGHTHVYVDGRLLTMAYEQSVPLPELDPGTHEIEITLASVDHSDYVLDGEILGARTTLEVEGAVVEADVTIEVSYSAGEVVVTDDRQQAPIGSTVDVIVTSDVDEELHIHGYDLSVEIGAGETQTVRFVADIPGIFEVELERSGTPVIELVVS